MLQQGVIPESRYARHESIDTPPPYTETSSDMISSRCSTPTSSVRSSPTLRSDSLTPPPVLGSKNAVPRHEVEETKAQLPSDLQRAKAPLRIRQKNSSITGKFLLLKDDLGDSKEPDVSLHTTNSSIKSAVYVEGREWGRIVAIEACTKNSSIALSVHTLKVSQAVDIRATTENSSNNVLLPRGFKGLLMLSTCNGKKVLSPELQRVSVRVSNQDSNMYDSSVGDRIGHLVGDETSTTKDWYEINGASGPSRAIVTTKNSGITVGFVGEESSGQSADSERCVLM